MTEPRHDSVKRQGPISDDERGPDSVECNPSTAARHDSCILDYTGDGPAAGFVCGCGCHDREGPDVSETRCSNCRGLGWDDQESNVCALCLGDGWIMREELV